MSGAGLFGEQRALPAVEARPGGTFQDQAVTGRVLLDDSRFLRCRFESAILVYTGQGAPPHIEACSFVECRFEFEGAADRTLSFLRAMARPGSGLSGIVRRSFPALFGH